MLSFVSESIVEYWMRHYKTTPQEVRAVSRMPVRALSSILAILVVSAAVQAGPAPERPDKPRVIILTDITNEPDDEESMVRFLVYSNEFDVVGARPIRLGSRTTTRLPLWTAIRQGT